MAKSAGQAEPPAKPGLAVKRGLRWWLSPTHKLGLEGCAPMAWYEDLAPCDYFGNERLSCLRAVGWLGRDHSFRTGPVAVEVYARLIELIKEPWQPVALGGVHRCEICLHDGPPGNRNLFVPSGEFAFVCPELITHYMNAHGYRPPDEFCAAVLTCPPMRSVPYLKALLAAARPLVQFAGLPSGAGNN